MCLAGVLESFRHAADDILRRFSGVRLSAASARRATQKAGEELMQQQRQGDLVAPPPAKPWDFSVEGQAGTEA